MFCSFICFYNVQPFIHWPSWSLTHTFIQSEGGSFIQPTIHSIIHSFIHVRWFVHLFTLQSSAYHISLTLIHSFIHLFFHRSMFCLCPFVHTDKSIHTSDHSFFQPFPTFIQQFICCLSIYPSIYPQLADLLFITTSHIQLWPLYEATANCRGQKYEINQTLLPRWPFSYWAAVKLSCYTVWMAPDGNCLEMADKFTCWAEVQNPLASSSAVSERKKNT